MTSETLAQALARTGNAVELLRNQDWPSITFPIKPEFTNWRDEQRAWSSTCLLYTSPSPRDGLLSRMPSSA